MRLIRKLRFLFLIKRWQKRIVKQFLKFTACHSNLENLTRIDSEKKNIIFWLPAFDWVHEFLMNIFWATILVKRHHSVIFIICDKILPYCWHVNEKNRGKQPCHDCYGSAIYTLKKLGFAYKTFSDFYTPDEMNAIIDDVYNEDFISLYDKKIDSYKIGKKTFEDYSHYFKATNDEITGNNLNLYRNMFISNHISYNIGQKIVKQFVPDRIVTFNGNSPQTHSIFSLCQSKKIKIFTWEHYGVYEDGYVFSNHAPANFIKPDKIWWNDYRRTELTEKIKKSVDDFQVKWKKGLITDLKYHPYPEIRIEEIKKEFCILPNKKTFVIFTNLLWETSCLGRDIGFNSLMDWIYSMIEYFSTCQETCQLIIRIHPAETRALPSLWITNNGVKDYILKKFKNHLPSNIIIIPSESDVFSYSLTELADAVGVYTSTIGFELALEGRNVWVAGDAPYRNLGFTTDIQDYKHLVSLLEQDKWEKKLTEKQQKYAYLFTYATYYRLISKVKFLKRDNSFIAKLPLFENYNFLTSNEINTVNYLAERIIDGDIIIDVPHSNNDELGNFYYF